MPINTKTDEYFLNNYKQQWLETPEPIRQQYRDALANNPEKLGANAVEYAKQNVGTGTMIGKAAMRGFAGAEEGVSKLLGDTQAQQYWAGKKNEAQREVYRPYVQKDDSTSEWAKSGSKNLLLGAVEMTADPYATSAMIATGGATSIGAKAMLGARGAELASTSKIGQAVEKSMQGSIGSSITNPYARSLIVNAAEGSAGLVGYDAVKNIMQDEHHNLASSALLGAGFGVLGTVASRLLRGKEEFALRNEAPVTRSMREQKIADEANLKAIEDGNIAEQKRLEAERIAKEEAQAKADAEYQAKATAEAEATKAERTGSFQALADNIEQMRYNKAQEEGFAKSANPLEELQQQAKFAPAEEITSKSDEALLEGWSNNFGRDVGEINRLLDENSVQEMKANHLLEKGYTEGTPAFTKWMEDESTSWKDIPTKQEAIDYLANKAIDRQLETMGKAENDIARYNEFQSGNVQREEPLRDVVGKTTTPDEIAKVQKETMVNVQNKERLAEEQNPYRELPKEQQDYLRQRDAIEYAKQKADELPVNTKETLYENSYAKNIGTIRDALEDVESTVGKEIADTAKQYGHKGSLKNLVKDLDGTIKSKDEVVNSFKEITGASTKDAEKLFDSMTKTPLKCKV